MRLFVGDDWAEDHHDVELMDVAGRVLAKARLPEGIAGMTRLHAMVAEQLGDAGPDEARVLVGIETDRGPWVAALAAAGYEVFAVNPLQAVQYRKRHAVPAPRATRVTRMCWPTWSAPTPTSCGPSPLTARRPKRSRLSPGCTRR